MQVGGWDLAALLAKSLLYGASLAAAGATAFILYIRGLVEAVPYRRIHRIALYCAVSAALLTLVRIVLLMAAMQDGLQGIADPGNAAMLLHGAEGRADSVRIAGLIVLLLALWRGHLYFALAAAAVVATSFAWVGHIHATLPRIWPSALLALHLAGAAFWFGALAPLYSLAHDHGSVQMAVIATRFSRIALVMVGLLVGAGVLMLLLLLPRVAALWQSDYGRLVAVKLVGVAALLAAALYNRQRVTVRLRAGATGALLTLRRCITVEFLCMALVLIATAAFTSVTGPGD